MTFCIVFKNGRSICFQLEKETQKIVIESLKKEMTRQDWIQVTHKNKTKHIQTREVSHIEEE